MYFLQFSKNVQRVCGRMCGRLLCLLVCDLRESRNKHRPKRKQRATERDRMVEREKESGLPTRVNIKLPKTICNFWKFCTVCCVWHREGTEGEGREGGSGDVLSYKLHAFLWHKFLGSLHTQRHTQPHTQAHTHKFITSGCGQKVCNILICVSAGAHLHVYDREGVGGQGRCEQTCPHCLWHCI